MTDTLSALDATFLELEQQDEGAVMGIGGVMVFDPLPGGGAPTVEDVCANAAARLEQLPRFSQKLSSPRVGGLAWPSWVSDERFDLRAHIKRVALPAPGGPSQLCDWAADFYSHRLDRTRPLWETAVIEGLEDGGWALANKTHHCLVDGVGSVDIAQVMLDAEPTAATRTPVAPRAPAGGSLQGHASPRPAAPIVQAARAGAHAASAGLHSMTHPREALERSLALAELIARDELIGAPHTSLNVPIGSSRRFAVVDVPLSVLKAIRRELGGSVNDAVLAACTTGLRHLLLERGEEPPTQGLRAMVPLNVREAVEHLALGNRVSSLFVELPVAEAVAHARYRRILATTERLKHSGAALGASTALDLAALAPPVVHALLARALYATRLFNVTITNVPGPQIPLYAFGARLRQVQPVVPLAAEHAAGIAVFSLNGLVTFGVIADSESTPDLAVLAHGIEAGIEELLALVPRADRPNLNVEARI
ncbi:MAG TPA: wax ester/triacylglycerol synthase family O-acyltransferase [Solirubrobacteraceae bacterium]|nr:wax ester/triacylglycerol synthase family O-acyltransferase [Solirubrobacteraceae bacterium]